MKTIILIIVGCWMLYKVGAVKRLLKAAVIQEPEPVKRSSRNQLQKIQEPPQISEREKLEKQARIIVSRMGENPDTVKYMGESLLRALITDYTNSNR